MFFLFNVEVNVIDLKQRQLFLLKKSISVICYMNLSVVINNGSFPGLALL